MFALSLIPITCLLFTVPSTICVIFCSTSKFVLFWYVFSVVFLYNLYLLMDDFYEFFFSYLNIPLLYLIVSFFVVCYICGCVCNVFV